jgi:hypothetical protein
MFPIKICKVVKSMSMPRFQRGQLPFPFSIPATAARRSTAGLDSGEDAQIDTHTSRDFLLAVHAPAERFVNAPHVPVERPDLLDSASVAVDLNPLDERAQDLLAGFADTHSEGRCDDNLVAVVEDLALGDFHAIEAGGHGLAPLAETVVALVFATVGHIGRLVDEDFGGESVFEVAEVTLLGWRGHVATLGGVEAGKNVLGGASVVADSPGERRPGSQVVGGSHDDDGDERGEKVV